MTNSATGGAGMRLAATVCTGVLAGLAGTLLVLVLRFCQQLAYGYSEESFLLGVTAATPLHRVLVLLGCGLLAGAGWFLLNRFGRPLVSVDKAVSPPARTFPAVETLCNALLQMVTVALGSPLGREGAPREAGALLAQGLARAFRLTPEESASLVACGAGAGFAAVYNVPLAGALFTLEVLLRSYRIADVVPALATSAIASLVAWLGLGNAIQYPVGPLAIDASLIAWSILAGPLLGLCAHAFRRATSTAAGFAPRDWRLVPANLLAFAFIGLLAAFYPQILGNGRGPIQLSFADALSMSLAAALLILRLAVTLAALAAGARGGVLTPSLTIGALLATVLGGLWSMLWPGAPLAAFALIGATAFLASARAMPLTAIVLMLEFTRVGQDFLFPMILAVAGALLADSLCTRRQASG
jgi:H+/Cl- antiporter ClcA